MEETILDALADSAIRLVAHAEEAVQAGRYLDANQTHGAVESLTRMVQDIQERDVNAHIRSGGVEKENASVEYGPQSPRN